MLAPTVPSLSRKFPWIALWVCGLWWLSREFFGPGDHDGIFYSGEAFRHLMPTHFEKDIFFNSTTQGNYSIFGLAYAQAIQFMDFGLAAWFMSLGGRLVWISGAWFLSRTLSKNLPESQRVAVLAVLLLLSSTYDGVGFFKSGEAVVTSRNWAEGLVLLAISQAVNRRRLWAWLLSTLALTLHPLMALPGLVIVWGLETPRIRSFTGWIGGSAIILAAAFQLDPIDRLFTTFDDIWWQIISDRNVYITPTQWPLHRISATLFLLVLCLYVAKHEIEASYRRLAQVVGYLTVIDLALWLIGVTFHNVLLVQLQLWRVLWIAQLLIPALWIRTLRPWSQWQAPDAVHVVLILAALISLSWSIHIGVLIGIWVIHPRARAFFAAHPLLARPSVIAASATFLLTLPAIYPDIVIHLFLFSQTTATYPTLLALCQEPVVTLPTLALVAALTHYLPKRHLTQPLIAVCLVGCGLYGAIDQWQKSQEPLADVRPLQSLIPPGASVYWDQGVIHTWLVLHRASYISFQQGSGAIFSRPLALEFVRRMRFLDEMGIHESGGRLGESSAPNSANPVGLCQDRALDFLLLQGSHPQATRQIPHPYAPYADPVLSIFDCAQLRHGFAPSR